MNAVEGYALAGCLRCARNCLDTHSCVSGVIATVAEGDMLRTQLAVLPRLGKYEPLNTIALRQQIAERVLEAGRYVVA